jgi:hypothetical protein
MYKLIGEPYYSNCLIAAVLAKMRHPLSVKVYYCPPNDRYKPHFMWSDGSADYDFSDLEDSNKICALQYIWYKGYLRQFKLGFAKKYSDYRKGRSDINEFS